MTTRVLPAPRGVPSVNTFGRIYTGVPGTTQDVPDQDAQILGANGWIILGLVGTTSQRPVNIQTCPTQPFPSQEFFDTTLGAWIIFDGLTWRNVTTGAAV
jgi:hypothetical protein